MMKIIFLFLLLFFSFSSSKDLSKAPIFQAKDIKGNTYDLSKHLGKGPIVINFWATWCIPCLSEMKKMKKTFKHYSKQGVSYLSISIDDNKTVKKVPGFVRSRRFPFTILLDEKKEIHDSFQVANVPELFVLNAKGDIAYHHSGFRKGDEKKLNRVLDQLLGKK